MKKHENRISLKRIEEAVHRIDPVFLNSPQFLSGNLSMALNTKVILKIETLNPIRSFKGRGSELFVSGLHDRMPVVCASAGNFGQAMAYSCNKKNIHITVFASTHANALKVEKMRAFGAEVILQGEDFDEAKSAARSYAEASGARFVEDSLDIETVEGAGTIGLELLGLPKPPEALLIALGNGALLTGIAKVFKEYAPATRIIAVQAEGAPAMIHSWKNGTTINYPEVHTIADGIAVRVPVPMVLADMQGLVDEGFLVKEEKIIQAMQLLYRNEGLVAEPSAVVGIATLLQYPEIFKDQTIVTIICGANMTEDQIKSWL
jgi:threonine dehydratase